MRKLTIILAVLMLCLQVFSCTVAYGSDEDEYIRIIACEPATNSPIHKDDVVEMGLVIKNETDKDMTDIEIIIKEASFSGWTSDQGPRIAELKSEEESDPIKFDVYYNGNGRDLVLEIRYKIEGKDDKANKNIKIPQAVPTQEPPVDTSQYVPRLVVDAGEMPVINAGSTYRLKYKIDNKSGHQAKNIDLSLKLLDEAKAPLVLENYYDMDRFISVINGNASEEVVFNVKISNLAPEGIYPLRLTSRYENAFGNPFTSEETVYFKVVNTNTNPIITVDSINVKKSDAASDVITLELKLKNLGNLRADDVKVTLGGLRSGGFTAYNTTDVRYIDMIYGNGSATVSYDLLPPPSGAAGSNELTVSFDYRDSAGNTYSEQNKIFIPAGEGEGTRPNITFEQITSPREALGAGREFNVSFNLRNSGGASARNVKVTLNTDAGIVIRSMNPVYFAGLDGNKSEKVTYTLFVADEAATRNYPISLNVEYEDAFGNGYNAAQYIGVYVENDAGKTVPRIIIDNYSLDPFPVNAGDDVTLTMSFLNTSKTVDVSNIKVTVISEDGTFTPTDSGNTFYIESIPSTQKVERELVLHAKPDAEQKSYMLTVNFEYEDERGNPFTAKETISTRVLQSPRLVTSDLSMMPETFVGQPVSVYLDFYNMGKSTLYNLMITVEGDFDGQGLSYYVGNFEPGRTDYYDATFIPMNPGMQKGSVLFTFEDANGKITEYRKEFELNVMEMSFPEPSFDDPGMYPGVDMPGMDMPGGPSKPGIWIYIGIGGAVLIVAVVVVVVLRKRSVRRKELSLDE